MIFCFFNDLLPNIVMSLDADSLHNFAEWKDAAVWGGPSTNNFRKT